MSARRRVHQRARKELEEPRQLFVCVARIAGEALVTTVARQRDGHVLAGHLRQEIGRQRRRIGERLAIEANQLGEQLGGARPQHLLVVVGLVELGDLARVLDLREVLLLEADGKGLHRLGADLAHDGDDRRRIDPARQERPQGNVGDEAEPHRFEQEMAQLFDQLAHRPWPGRELELPVFLFAQSFM